MRLGMTPMTQQVKGRIVIIVIINVFYHNRHGKNFRIFTTLFARNSTSNCPYRLAIFTTQTLIILDCQTERERGDFSLSPTLAVIANRLSFFVYQSLTPNQMPDNLK